MSDPTHMALRLSGAVISAGAANGAAAVLSAQSGNWSPSAIVGWVTAVILGICGTIIAVTPMIAKAIQTLAATILPALAAIRKQNEDLNKGTLSEQITLLQKTVEEARAYAAAAEQRAAAAEKRADDANKKMHDFRNDANVLSLRHAAENQRLTDQLEFTVRQLKENNDELHTAREELSGLRMELSQRDRRMTASQKQQDVQISRNAQAIVDVATQAGVASAASPEQPTNTEKH